LYYRRLMSLQRAVQATLEQTASRRARAETQEVVTPSRAGVHANQAGWALDASSVSRRFLRYLVLSKICRWSAK